MKSNFVNPIELNQRLNKPLLLSSRQLGWTGILVEQYQSSPTSAEVELPALSDHLLSIPDETVHLIQKRGSSPTIIPPGNSIFVPAGQPSYWRYPGKINARLAQSATPNYIHTHLNQELSLPELASVISVSPNYFASLFKQTMRISPHQYVIQQRVEQAKVMLAKTNLAIADIALQVGFSSQSHLTQQFKHLTGMTPKQVR